MDYRAIVNRVPRPTPARPVGAQQVGAGAPAQRPAVRRVVPPSDAKEITCDQAIFTSIRTPTGEGYRIVAASPGLGPEEKAEITRKSPSHGSLAGLGASAVGLLAYPLPTGRYCVSHSQNAGAEYTGRGGERVWTQIAVLDRDAYLAFGRNPIRVHRVLGQATRTTPTAAPRAVLERLTLRAWNHVESAPPSYTAENVVPLVRVASSLLRGVQWVMTGAANPETMLEWAFDVLPLWTRTGISVSCGLEFSLTRAMQMNMVCGDQDLVERMIRGHNIRWCDLNGKVEMESSAFDQLLALIRASAIEGRLKAVARLAIRMIERAEPAVLQRAVQLHKDTEAARKAEPVAAEMRKKYATYVPCGALECELLTELRKVIDPAPAPSALPGTPLQTPILPLRRSAFSSAPPTPRPA